MAIDYFRKISLSPDSSLYSFFKLYRDEEKAEDYRFMIDQFISFYKISGIKYIDISNYKTIIKAFVNIFEILVKDEYDFKMLKDKDLTKEFAIFLNNPDMHQYDLEEEFFK